MADSTLFSGRRWHDMGGLDAGGIDPDTHDYALWEKRVDALMVIASSKGLMTVDGLRRVLEDMGPEAFETMTYYERWISSVTQNMIESGAFSIEELNAKMEEVAARGATYGEAQGAAE
ncbi:MAG: ScnB-like protein [Pseudomonadota bacterium]